MTAVHCDIFGVYDMLSHKGGETFYHQVTAINMKSKKFKKIKKRGISGFIWCRTDDRDEIVYRVFFVDCKDLTVKEKGEVEYVEDTESVPTT